MLIVIRLKIILYGIGDIKPSIHVSPLSTTTYYVTVIEGQCSSTGMSVLFVSNNISVLQTSKQLSVCRNNYVNISLIPYYDSYQWSNNANSSDINVFVQYDTIFYVTVKSGQCNIIDSVLVSTFNNPVIVAYKDTALIKGLTVPFIATGGSRYRWYPDIDISCVYCSNPQIYVRNDIDYVVEGYDDNGCFSRDTVSIKALSLEEAFDIPNTFTPNGDGKNDKWHIKYISAFPNNYLEIYNRWGEKVYTRRGYDNSFDGRGLPDGTYYYVLKLADNIPILKGDINIIR